MSRFKMFSDDALAKFRTFLDAAGLPKQNPEGAFDVALPKVALRKDPYRFVPIDGCGNRLFLRSRSSNVAFDEATEISDPAKDILNFLKDKLSAEELHQVEELLKMEAGVPVDSTVKAEQMIDGAEARRQGAQDAKRREAHASASTARMDDFASRFPGAARVGRV